MTSEGSQGHRACGACVQFTEHFLFDKEEAYVYVCVCACPSHAEEYVWVCPSHAEESSVG